MSTSPPSRRIRAKSVNTLISHPAPGNAPPPILPPVDGLLALDRAKMSAAFAADVNPQTAAFRAASQIPWGVEGLSGAITDPA